MVATKKPNSRQSPLEIKLAIGVLNNRKKATKTMVTAIGMLNLNLLVADIISSTLYYICVIANLLLDISLIILTTC